MKVKIKCNLCNKNVKVYAKNIKDAKIIKHTANTDTFICINCVELRKLLSKTSPGDFEGDILEIGTLPGGKDLKHKYCKMIEL